MQLIAVAGDAGCGKDTVADFLEEEAKEQGRRVVRLKFAGALREDLIAGAESVQAFWHELNSSLAAPTLSTQQADLWDRCLPNFSDLRERTLKNIIQGQPPIIPSELPSVPSGIINTDDRSIKENPHAACGGLSPRNLMQAYGSYMRNTEDENYWADRLAQTVKRIQSEEPAAFIIITDARYTNEANVVRGLGGQVVHVLRRNSENALHGASAAHESERGVPVDEDDWVLFNSGTLGQLREAARSIMTGDEHPLLSRQTLWGTSETLSTALATLQATLQLCRQQGFETLAQPNNVADLLAKNKFLLHTPIDQIALTQPQPASDMELLLTTSRRLAEHSPMGTTLQLLAERIANGETEACAEFGAISACAGVAERTADVLSDDMTSDVFQGHLDAVIERAVFCQAVANEDVGMAATALQSMLAPFSEEPDREWCEQLAQEVIEQPLRECHHEPFADAALWMQRPDEDGWNAPVYLRPDASTAITALLHFEPHEGVAQAAVQSILEQGDAKLFLSQEQQAGYSIEP
ncbi:MAG: hypothetical protein IKZ87_01245 [Actinomycetaceae bacterium]|nr:hypothetical protein [Actinomycetaceae bacterium]